ncbi:hypothetical protein DL768_011528 [Monosporascus sp. mg162]|nr:hypothetical protein DL768_011528 [Monosporascus sp. mg162]
MPPPAALPTVDIFILTFNAAKNSINVPGFANHLYNAFHNNATTLPELVVLSLQEMAPLAKAFIGGSILKPYFQRYESAVNLAAAKFLTGEGQTPPKDNIYRLATVRNVSMTGIMLLARDKYAVRNVRTTELSFGAADMANKGAVGLRFLYTKEDESGQSRQTELTFVGTHLQAFEWKLETRNKNWQSIVSGLVFEDPRRYISGRAPQSEDGGEEQRLLEQDGTQRALHDISIYKPGSHLFVTGDLNYRLSTTAPETGAVFPSIDPGSPDHYSRFFVMDQLTAEKAAGRTLHGLSEAEIKFPPTYKLKVLPKKRPETETDLLRAEQGEDDDEEEGAEWKWVIYRWPGWCDRVLYLDIPWWAKDATSSKNLEMKVTAYNALPAVRTSDHRAVYLRVDVPVIEPADLAPSPAAIEAELTRSINGHMVDPRVRLPFPIDPGSWDHRTFVKQCERVIGWSMLIFQSKPIIKEAGHDEHTHKINNTRAPCPMSRMPSLIPDILSSPSPEGNDRRYVARARRDRRLELAAWDLRGLRTQTCPSCSASRGASAAALRTSTSPAASMGEKEKNGVVDEEGKGERDGEPKGDQKKNVVGKRNVKGGGKREWKGKKQVKNPPSLHDDLVAALPPHSRPPWFTTFKHPALPPTVQQPPHHPGYQQRDFSAILAQVDTGALASLALQTLKQRRGPSYYAPLPCVGRPVFGSAHVLYPVSFDDGRRTRWIVKVPVTGTPDVWDELGSDALRGEALVLRMLGTLGRANGRENGRGLKGSRRGEGGRFPAPEPVRVDPGVHNALHAPYLIMEFVEGIRLDEYWFAGTDAGTHGKTYTSYSADHVKLRRRKVLHSLARTMLRLGTCGTEQGGGPVIDEATWRVLPGAAAPARHLDVGAMVGRWLDRSDGRGTEDERTPVYAAVWPHDDPRETYTAPLDRYPPTTEAARGVDALLRLLIGMLREPGRAGGAEGEGEGAGTLPFVLAHPDLQLRHVIVSEDGEVAGIVGWDGVRAVPRSVGNEALPRWLVRDFNPFVYGWRPAAAAAGLGLVAASDAPGERARSGSYYSECPPWAPAELRDAYVDIVRRLKREKTASGTGVRGATARGNYQRNVDVTRLSLLALSLDEAVRDPRCRGAILRRVLEKCSTRFEEPLEYEYFVDVLGCGDRLDRRKMRRLARNFAELAERGVEPVGFAIPQANGKLVLGKNSKVVGRQESISVKHDGLEPGMILPPYANYQL